MTTTSQMPVIPPQPKPPRARRWPKRIGLAVAALALFAVGVGIGAAGNSHGSALAKAQHTASAERGQIATLQAQVAQLQAQLTTAQQKAATAQRDANAKAASDYAARNAALQKGEADLKQQQNALNAEIGQVQANQISDSGVYVVGKDIKAGTWHTPGDNGQGDNSCYFATLNSTNTDDISDNNNFDGAETVDLSGVYAFDISGPCTWYLVG